MGSVSDVPNLLAFGRYVRKESLTRESAKLEGCVSSEINHLFKDLCNQGLDGRGGVYLHPIVKLREGFAKSIKKVGDFRIIATFIDKNLTDSVISKSRQGSTFTQ